MEKQLIPELRFSEFDAEWKGVELKKIATINPKNDELPNSFVYIDLESVNKGLLSKEERVFKSDAPSRAQRLLKNEDILYQTVRPYQKNNYFFDRTENDYVASTGYAQIRTKNSSKYLYQYLHTNYFVNKVLVRCTGTSYPAINSTDLSKIKVSIPQLPEQQKIATFLTDVDDKITKLTKNKDLLEQYKKGVMQKIFNQELRFKDDDGNNFPNWQKTKLGKSVKFLKGKGLPKSEIVCDGQYKCIHYGELFTKYNELIDNIISRTNDNDNDKTILSKVNDVLMPTSDVTPNGLATASCIKESDVILGGDVLIIRQDIKKIEGVYLAYYIKHFRNDVMKLVSGSTVYHLYGSDMKNLQVLIPCLDEQTKIANFLSDIDLKIAVLNTKIESNQNFKKGLLQKMFV
jgi:type I restriction enzyme S subunit